MWAAPVMRTLASVPAMSTSSGVCARKLNVITAMPSPRSCVGSAVVALSGVEYMQTMAPATRNEQTNVLFARTVAAFDESFHRQPGENLDLVTSLRARMVRRHTPAVSTPVTGCTVPLPVTECGRWPPNAMLAKATG